MKNPVEQSIEHCGKSCEIGKALETQARVVFAVILRETKSRYGEHKLGFLWVLIEPSLFIIGFTVLRTLLGARAVHGMDPALFMLTGIAPYMLFRDTMSNVTSAIGANKALLAFPQVTTFDLILARTLLEFATIITVFVTLLVGIMAMGIEVQIENPIQLFGSFVLMSIAGIGVGASLCSIEPFFPSVKQLSAQILGRPLFFTSGIFFTADQLPESARTILLYNPLLHVTEFARSAFFKSFESVYMDLGYAGLFCLLLLVFGLMMHQALHKKVLGL